MGCFHHNKGRTIHKLHWGRGETFTVGHDVANGEKLQWIVEDGKFKTSFLLPDAGEEASEKGYLISDTVMPSFEYADHDFVPTEELKRLVNED